MYTFKVQNHHREIVAYENKLTEKDCMSKTRDYCFDLVRNGYKADKIMTQGMLYTKGFWIFKKSVLVMCYDSRLEETWGDE